MQLSKEWLAQLPLTNITSVTPVSGGDINAAFAVQTAHHRYFLKVQPQRGAAFFSHEVAGLALLEPVVATPHVIANGTIDGDGYLLLSWLEAGHGSQRALGQAVARVHQQHASQFGLDHDFTLGKIPKLNHWQHSWATFYTQQRLDVLVKLAQDQGHWSAQRAAHYQRLRKHILAEDHMRTVQPSLLHGDLWSGNYLFTADGTPTLIDPDVFYGDREMDLAMTTIFGGFSDDFYAGYQQVYPIAPGFEERLPEYQLYYLLAHLNLFGETYGPAVDRILNRY
ncbi:fructosamine kinase family protein [Lactiplantibacillus garii]|uniref:Fructosamine kinase family protein n=1 Tax=Lactiplantibacillus garii TaxID=2306423 RepID=A0A3R8L0D7_9LACO|nr:fructosamine kinase family protein [Lactiplantibacillus garii]RRK10045.1 fructosamine kinase family protein [Lactiplantibacillus garii]